MPYEGRGFIFHEVYRTRHIVPPVRLTMLEQRNMQALSCNLRKTACRSSEGQAVGLPRSARRGVQHAGSAPVQCMTSRQSMADEATTRSRDPNSRHERSSVTAVPHGTREPSQRIRSATATLSNALLQTAASEATSQLWGAVTQANKLTRGFQPRPVGYPPGHCASTQSASDRMR